MNNRMNPVCRLSVVRRGFRWSFLFHSDPAGAPGGLCPLLERVLGGPDGDGQLQGLVCRSVTPAAAQTQLCTLQRQQFTIFLCDVDGHDANGKLLPLRRNLLVCWDWILIKFVVLGYFWSFTFSTFFAFQLCWRSQLSTTSCHSRLSRCSLCSTPSLMDAPSTSSSSASTCCSASQSPLSLCCLKCRWAPRCQASAAAQRSRERAGNALVHCDVLRRYTGR